MSKLDKFEHLKDWDKWIGLEIIKHSGKPFKSGLKIGRVRELTTNPYSLKDGFLMDDGTIVDCHQCLLKN